MAGTQTFGRCKIDNGKSLAKADDVTSQYMNYSLQLCMLGNVDRKPGVVVPTTSLKIRAKA